MGSEARADAGKHRVTEGASLAPVHAGPGWLQPVLTGALWCTAARALPRASFLLLLQGRRGAGRVLRLTEPIGLSMSQARRLLARLELLPALPKVKTRASGVCAPPPSPLSPPPGAQLTPYGSSRLLPAWRPTSGLVCLQCRVLPSLFLHTSS